VPEDYFSDNFYWLAAEKADYRRMKDMPTAALTVTAKIGAPSDGEEQLMATLLNSGENQAIAVKRTLEEVSTGERARLSYYSDNCVSLLPSETKQVPLHTSIRGSSGAVKIALRGWNISTGSVAVTHD
jgi:hypothetical protein